VPTEGQNYNLEYNFVRLWPIFIILSPQDSAINITASATYAVAVSVYLCLTVCMFVARRNCVKTAKRKITQTTPHDSPGTVVFPYRRFGRNSNGFTPKGTPNAGGVG